MSSRHTMRLRLVTLAVLVLSTLAGPASAHTHMIDADGDGSPEAVLANGQLHGAFVGGVSCGGDPAAYGLETAHHGPDAGDPGRADGCFTTTGNVAPWSDLGPASRVIK